MIQEPDRSTLAHRLENFLSIVILTLLAVLPLLEVAGRMGLGYSLPGSIPLVQHLTLWITLVGAALAARSGRLLALSTLSFLPQQWRSPILIFTSAIATGVTFCLFLASLDFVRIERQAESSVAWGIPVWFALVIMPASFAVITARLIWHSSEHLRGRLWAALGLTIPLLFEVTPDLQQLGILLPASLVIVAATALGMPIFAGIGGAALLLLWDDGTPINAVVGATYTLTTQSLLPAIPLFALGGYILAAGGAGQRLTRLFRGLVGWMPGGLAIATTLVLAFFTPLTGASGITIVSMGGLLLPALKQEGYPERTSIGLVTVSGSIGLLFPPSLPVFLYAIYTEQPFQRLFIGGLLPGILLVLVVAAWAAQKGWRHGAIRTPFRSKEAAAALWLAKWDLLLPVVVLGGIFGGLTTVVEAAALTVLYSFLIECFVHRKLSPFKDLPGVFRQCATLLGGFMIILGVALGFTNFLILAEIPMQALAWVQQHIESPLLFLLALNIFLILVGALMDIYSAIFVVVPLIFPMAQAYGIDPIHLGIIFLANMELGYLMPPMGENLFLSSYRFDQPLTGVYRSTLPYVLILLVTVLLITYLPALTLWPLGWQVW